MSDTVRTALIFPGQGSQEAGMGRDAAENSKEAMELWKKAEKISGLPLRELYWDSGDAVAMADTRALQPALTVVNMTLWMEYASKFGSDSVCCAAGHSLGEYSALAAARVLSPEQTLEAVSIRGQLMADADPDHIGAMAAVLRLDLQQVETIVREATEDDCLNIANYNTPTQIVVSGSKPAVERVLGLAKQRKGRAILLPVSGAFHSPMLKNAAEELKKVLDRLTWNRPVFPIYCDVTGCPATDGESLHDLVSVQMTSSVRWMHIVENQWKDGVRRWIELGPKGALTRMVDPILRAVDSDAEFEARNIGSLAQMQD